MVEELENIEVVCPDSFSSNLIDLVHAHPILWDMSGKKYGKNKKKTKEIHWEQIANDLGSDVTSVKSVWKSLRTVYSRELKNRTIIKSGGEGGKSDELIYTGPWVHFLKLHHFLKKSMKCRNTSGNLDGYPLNTQSHAGGSIGTPRSQAGSSNGTPRSQAGSSNGTPRSQAGGSNGTPGSQPGGSNGTPGSLAGGSNGIPQDLENIPPEPSHVSTFHDMERCELSYDLDDELEDDLASAITSVSRNKRSSIDPSFSGSGKKRKSANQRSIEVEEKKMKVFYLREQNRIAENDAELLFLKSLHPEIVKAKNKMSLKMKIMTLIEEHLKGEELDELMNTTY